MHLKHHELQTPLPAGYGGSMVPNPDCGFVNFVIMVQSIASALLSYLLLGVVFARCAAAPASC